MKRPEHLFVLSSVILMLLAFLGPEQTIDFHVHDTYFVVGKPFLFLAPAILLFIFWLVYVLCRGVILSGVLTWIHVLPTLAFVVLLFYHPANGATVPRRYLAVNPFYRYEPWERWLVAAFALAQVAFLVNAMGGAVRGLFRR